MDRAALRAALVEAGIPDAYYVIEGVHEPHPAPTDHLYLRRLPDGGWETGACERGAREPISRHAEESAACAHLLHLLT